MTTWRAGGLFYHLIVIYGSGEELGMRSMSTRFHSFWYCATCNTVTSSVTNNQGVTAGLPRCSDVLLRTIPNLTSWGWIARRRRPQRTDHTNAIDEFTADSRGFVKSSQGINSNIRRIREWVRNGFATGSQMSRSRRIRENVLVHSVHNGFARIRKRVHNGFARVCIWVHGRFARIVKTIRRCYTVHRACT